VNYSASLTSYDAFFHGLGQNRKQPNSAGLPLSAESGLSDVNIQGPTKYRGRLVNGGAAI